MSEMGDQRRADVESSESKFWKTQPIQHVSSEPKQIQQIDRAAVPKKALEAPPFLRFEAIDFNVPAKLNEIQQFLEAHYVSDSANKSRFAYSGQFLRWWLSVQCNTISVGLRVVKADDLSAEHKTLVQDFAEDELVGYISSLPQQYIFQGLATTSQSVDFLCVHKRLRSLQLAPLLIQEITRRSYKQGIFTAVFTAAFTAHQAKPTIPPILIAQYHHYLLNPVKLYQCDFCSKPHRMSDRDFEHHYKLEYVKSQIQSCFRPFEPKKDGAVCCEMLNNFQRENYKIVQQFEPQAFARMFKPIPNVIQSFVIERDQKVIAFTSYYIVDTKILAPEIRKQHQGIRNGYFYHYCVDSTVQDPVSLRDLQLMVLHQMKRDGIDVATCLDICKNKELIRELKMDSGDGRLGYHTFNLDWGKDIQHEDLGIVLV